MSHTAEIDRQKREAEESPATWLLAMAMAAERGEIERMAQAQRRLREMGITVKWPLRARRRAEAAHV